MFDTSLPKSQSRGFDNRIIEYEKVHKIKEADFSVFIQCIDPQAGQIILDGCCGYGSVTKRILDLTLINGYRPEIYLLDQSPVQLARAKERFTHIPRDHFKLSEMCHTDFKSDMFDKVAVKMSIHELPNLEQPIMMTEVYRILKKGGSFVTWELALDAENQKLFQDFINEKDRLAGFDELVNNRYFPRLDELHELFKNAGFVDIEDYHTIWYSPSTKARQDELVSTERKLLLDENGSVSEGQEAELQRLGQLRAKQLTEWTRKNFPERLKVPMKYLDFGDDIQFEIRKMIIRGRKQ
jgi:ubiquinone/menaquinone biosynthesis C-methylase UbiE